MIIPYIEKGEKAKLGLEFTGRLIDKSPAFQTCSCLGLPQGPSLAAGGRAGAGDAPGRALGPPDTPRPPGVAHTQGSPRPPGVASAVLSVDRPLAPSRCPAERACPLVPSPCLRLCPSLRSVHSQSLTLWDVSAAPPFVCPRRGLGIGGVSASPSVVDPRKQLPPSGGQGRGVVKKGNRGRRSWKGATSSCSRTPLGSSG